MPSLGYSCSCTEMSMGTLNEVDVDSYFLCMRTTHFIKGWIMGENYQSSSHSPPPSKVEQHHDV